MIVMPVDDGRYAVQGSTANASDIKIRLQLYSQKPLIDIHFLQDKQEEEKKHKDDKRWDTYLSCDMKAYLFCVVHEPAEVKKLLDGCKDDPAVIRLLEEDNLIALFLERRPGASGSLSKGHSHRHITDPDLRGTWDRIKDQEGITILLQRNQAWIEGLEYFAALQDMRQITLKDAPYETDFWWFAKQEGFSTQAGNRLVEFIAKHKIPDLPWHWATNRTLDRDGNLVAVNAGFATPPVDSFHDLEEYEMTMGLACLYEREEAKALLVRTFDGHTLHKGDIEPITSLSRSKAVWLHVHINKDEAAKYIVPAPPAQVRVNFQEEGEDPVFTESRGFIVDRPSKADFVIFLKVKHPVSAAKQVQFTMTAVVNTIPHDRMLAGIRHVSRSRPWEEQDEDERSNPKAFVISETLEAHGPKADAREGHLVNILDHVPEADRHHAAQTIERVKQEFGLDPTQTAATNAVFGNLVAGVELIHGPPGTGKTRVNACIAVAAALCGLKVLVCAASNGGVNNLLLAIVDFVEHHRWVKDALKRKGDIVRFRTPAITKGQVLDQQDQMSELADLARMVDYIEPRATQGDAALTQHEMSAIIKRNIALAQDTGNELWLELGDYRERMKDGAERCSKTERTRFNSLLEAAETAILEDACIIGSTLSNCAVEQFTGGKVKIDLVLEDEAGQAMEPDTDIALRLKPKVLVLTGDDHQLPPTVMSNNGKLNPFFRQLSVSLFTRLCKQGYSFHRLRTNYRMHKDLSDFPNATEYDGELINHPSTEAPTPQSLLWEDFVAQHPALSQAQHTRRIVINVPGASQQDRGSTSRYSDKMLKATDDFVHQFLSFRSTRVGAQPRLKGKDLCIIATYKDQRRKLNHVLMDDRTEAWDPERADTKAATIDAFHGRECPFVLANLLTIDGAEGRIGFLEDRRRLNVALTRGKYALVILLDYTGLIKHADGWASGPSKSGTTVFGKFLQDIRRKRAIIPWELFTATDPPPPPPPPAIRATPRMAAYKRPHSDTKAGPSAAGPPSAKQAKGADEDMASGLGA